MFRTCRFFLASSSSSSSSSSRRALTSLDIHAAYRVLGLPTTASPDDARQRYLKLARQYHPDISSQPEKDDSKMKAVNIAYEVVQAHGSKLSSSSSSSSSSQQRQQRKQQRGEEGDDDDFTEEGEEAWKPPKSGKRNSTFADANSWNTRPEFEWSSEIFDNVNEREALNPRNHPHTFNRFFSFSDDAAIFRAVRSGANIAEVARTMGRTPYAIEARMNSTQFKLRVQKLLRSTTSSSYHSSSSSSPEEEEQQQQEEEGEEEGGENTKNKASARDRARGRRENERKLRQQHSRGGGFGLNSKSKYRKQVFPFYETVRRQPKSQQEQQDERYASPAESVFLHPEEGGGGEGSSSSFGQEFSTKNIASAHGRSYAYLQRHMRK